MDINLGSNFGGNMGVRPEAQGAGVGGVDHAPDAAKTHRRDSNLTVGKEVARLASSEPTAEVPPDALVRDDKLGQLVSAAFSLAPPPMPSFGG